MKIGIVTVYKSDNYGAFLQAFALSSYFSQLGHKVYFIKNKSRNINTLCIKKIIKKIMHRDRNGYSFQFKRRKIFLKSTMIFKEININKNEDLDLIVFGSDEIWNISRKNVYKYPILFGVGIDNKNKISYAPSINNANVNDFLSRKKYLNSIANFLALSVRDVHSKNVLQNLLKRDVQIVVDPTFLMDKAFYHSKMNEPIIEFDYILVYSYGINLVDKIINKVKNFAMLKKYKLVSILENFEWCDYNIPTTPYGMLGYFNNAKYIVTDTFHGVAFSLIFNKDFAVISEKSYKVINLLNEFNLENRVVTDALQINDIMTSSIPYDTVNFIIEDKKDKSKNFFDSVLKKL